MSQKMFAGGLHMRLFLKYLSIFRVSYILCFFSKFVNQIDKFCFLMPNIDVFYLLNRIPNFICSFFFQIAKCNFLY